MDKLDRIASVIHKEWIEWSRETAHRERISEATLRRWKSRWIPFEHLPDKEKERDRIWARRILQLVRE